MSLPNKCSHNTQRIQCNVPPSYLFSIHSNEEFMVAVSCEEHKLSIDKKIRSLQEKNLLPKGKIQVQDIKIVTTNCIKPTEVDYQDVFYNRSPNL